MIASVMIMMQTKRVQSIGYACRKFADLFGGSFQHEFAEFEVELQVIQQKFLL